MTWLQTAEYRAGNSQGLNARLFQVVSVEDECLECVSWDDINEVAGDTSIWIAKPKGGEGEYAEDDIITAMFLPQPVFITRDPVDPDPGVELKLNWIALAGGGGGGTASARCVVAAPNDPHSGLLTQDGVAVHEGDTLLDFRNSDATKRGLWTAKTGAWERTGTLKSGMLVSVREGTQNGSSVWMLRTNSPIDVGTTSLTFTRLIQNTAITTVRAMSAAALTRNGPQTVDGIACVADDLVFDQGSVYQVNAGAWSLNVSFPNLVLVTEGNAKGPLMWAKQKSGSYVALAGVYS